VVFENAILIKWLASLRMLNSEVAEAFGAGAAGDDARAAFHDDLDAGGVIRLDDGDEFEIDEMRAMDAKEVRRRKLGLKFVQADADKVML